MWHFSLTSTAPVLQHSSSNTTRSRSSRSATPWSWGSQRRPHPDLLEKDETARAVSESKRAVCDNEDGHSERSPMIWDEHMIRPGNGRMPVKLPYMALLKQTQPYWLNLRASASIICKEQNNLNNYQMQKKHILYEMVRNCDCRWMLQHLK